MPVKAREDSGQRLSGK